MHGEDAPYEDADPALWEDEVADLPDPAPRPKVAQPRPDAARESPEGTAGVRCSTRLRAKRAK